MRARWLIVAVTAALLIAVPVLVAARPTSESTVSAVELASRVQQSAGVAWSGQVESTGSLQVPDTDAFANLAEVLGQRNQLRVWWRTPEEWRIDSIRSTGETDLFSNGHVSVRWEFESQRATIAPVSTIRLPAVSDLLPSTLARLLLENVPAEELVRLPSRRVAGVAAAGLRFEPSSPDTTIARIDLWAEPQSGLPLEVQVFGAGDRRAIVHTTVTALDLGAPAASVLQFDPAPGVELVYEDAVDVAAAANAFAPYDLPARLGGLEARGGVDPGPVGVYGHGPTSLIVLPLRGQVARPFRQRLRESPTARESSLGTGLTAGPVGLLLTPRDRGGTFLLAGTVTDEVLQRGASELLAER